MTGWIPPWEAWADAVERRREAERAGKPTTGLNDRIELYRTESAFLIAFLLSVAKDEDGIRQQVYETLAAFKVPDPGARAWLRDIQKRVEALEDSVTALAAENGELKDRLGRLEPPDMEPPAITEMKGKK